MLGKLSLRNAKRQARDYLVYFVTMIIAVSLIFSFNSIVFSQEVSSIGGSMNFFGVAIILVSALVVFVIGWLVNYTMNFMLQKRSKEFGLYTILGIENKDISNLFMFENVIIGVAALLVGIVCGSLLYQIMVTLIMHIFEQSYDPQIGFSIGAFLLTIVYYSIIFLFALSKCKKRLNKTKVYSLLYADKQNEEFVLQDAHASLKTFIVFVISGLVGIVTIISSIGAGRGMSGISFAIIAISLVICIFSFYSCIVAFVANKYNKDNELKYKDNNMFLFRTLASKINTMSVTMSILALLFTLAVILLNTGVINKSNEDLRLAQRNVFDIQMQSNNKEDFARIVEYIEKDVGIEDIYNFNLYQSNDTHLINALEGSPSGTGSYYEYEPVMKLSDYNYLRSMAGLDNVTLETGEFSVHCVKSVQSYFKDYLGNNKEIIIDDLNYKIGSIYSENFAQTDGFNGWVFVIILPDEAVSQLETNECRCALNAIGVIGAESYIELENEIATEDEEDYEDDEEITSYFILSIKEKERIESLSGNIMLSFPLFYVAIIMIITATTILSVQQLSDSEKHKQRYKILGKIGLDSSEISMLVFKQLLIYFTTPLILPLILGSLAVFAIGSTYSFMVSMGSITLNLIITILLFIAIYAIYFYTTFLQFIRNINN